MGHFLSIPVRLSRAWTITLIALALLGLVSCGGASRSGVLPLDESVGPGESAGTRGASATWGSVTVDIRPWGGNNDSSSVAIVNGNPAIAYAVAIQQRVKGKTTYPVSICYARSDANGNWSVKTVVPPMAAPHHVYTYARLAVVNGYPAISYYNTQSQDLCFVRANNADGSNTWGTPQTIDSAGDVGQGAWLMVVNGNPAIAYLDATNSKGKYVRATNASGTAWGPRQVLDTTSGTSGSGKLEVVDGYPAISYPYTDSTNTIHELRYIRATNADGSGAWGAPQTVQSGMASYITCRLAVVNNNPAICFSAADSVANGVYYIRANDDGTWPAAAVNLDGGDSTGNADSGSIAVVNGVPAVACFRYDTSSGALSLRYIQALNANGSAWEAPQTLLAPGAWIHPSLAEVASGAGIAYYDAAHTMNYIWGH